MRNACCLLGLLCILSVPAVHGAEVTLKNGDRLTGKIVRMDKNSMDLETELVGKVTIPSGAIVRIDGDKPLYVTVGETPAVKAYVSMRDGMFEIRSDEQTKEYKRGAIRTLRSEEAYKIESHPMNKAAAPAKTPTVWGGSVDTAISISRGNSETQTLNLGLRLARVTPKSTARFYFTSIFSETVVNSETRRFSEIFRGGSRYEVNFGKRLLTFGFTDLERDRNQGLDSRFVTGGGLGMRLIKNKMTSLKVFAGGSANHEEFVSGASRLSSEFVAGTDISQKMTSATSFTQSLIVYPNLSSRGEYRVTFDSSVVTQLNKWLAWHITTANRYVSNPASGGKTNDLLLTTGIRFVRRGETLANLEARPELRRP